MSVDDNTQGTPPSSDPHTRLSVISRWQRQSLPGRQPSFEPFGLWGASIALSRAASGHSIRSKADALSRLGMGKPIAGAKRLNLIDRQTTDLATQVKIARERLLHGHPCNEKEAWHAICAARLVILKIGRNAIDPLSCLFTAGVVSGGGSRRPQRRSTGVVRSVRHMTLQGLSQTAVRIGAGNVLSLRDPEGRRTHRSHLRPHADGTPDHPHGRG